MRMHADISHRKPTFGVAKRWFWRMFPRNGNRNEGTFGCSPGTKTGTRVRSHVPPGAQNKNPGTRVHSSKPPFYETALQKAFASPVKHRRILRSVFPCDFRSSEGVFASLAKNVFSQSLAILRVCDFESHRTSRWHRAIWATKFLCVRVCSCVSGVEQQNPPRTPT